MRRLSPTSAEIWPRTLCGAAALLLFAACRPGQPAGREVPARPDLTRFAAEYRAAVVAAERVIADTGAPEERLKLGRLYHANGFPVQAMACYLPLTEHGDEGLRARAAYHLADLAETAGDLEKQSHWLRMAVAGSAPYVPAEVRLADLLYKTGETGAALEHYGMVLRREPGNFPALLAFARHHMRTGDLAKAEAALAEAVRHTPRSSSAYALYAQLYELRRENSQAAGMREKAQAFKDPRSPDPWMDEVLEQCHDGQRLSMLLEDSLKSGQVAETAKWLARLARVSPSHWLVSRVRGAVFIERGQLAEAAAEYRRSLAHGGDKDRLYPLLVAVLIRQKDYRQAHEAAARGLADRPGNTQLMALQAEILARQGAWQQAVTRAGEVLAIEPRNPTAAKTLALTYWERNEREKALPLLTMLAELAPADVRNRLMLAEYHLDRDALADAEAALLAVRRFDPENAAAAAMLGLVHLRHGNQKARAGEMAEAMLEYDRASELDPLSADAPANKALLLVRGARAAEARAVLEAYLRRNPGSPKGWMVLGDVNMATGNPNLAGDCWSKALRLVSDREGEELREGLLRRLGPLARP